MPGSSLSVSDVFVYVKDGARVSVSGNPNMSNVQGYYGWCQKSD